MKHIILYPLISALTLSVSGVGSYLYQELSHKNNHTDTSEPDDTDDDDFVPPIEEEPGFSKMINKLMATKEVKAKKASVVLSTTGNDDIYLNLSNLDVDLSGVLSGDMSALKLNGTLNVKYRDINEELSVYYDTDMLYMDYAQKSFAFSAPNTIAGLTGILSKLNINVPSLPDFGNLDISEIMSGALGILDTVEEKKTENGYAYILDCNDFISSLNLPIEIKGAKLALYADSDYNFIGGATVDEGGININSSYSIKLDVGGIEVQDSSNYVGLSAEQKKNYTDLTSRTTNIATTLATLMDKKNFSADFNVDVSLEENSIQKQTFQGTLQADLSTIVKDVSKGEFEISLNHLNNGKQANSIYATYKDNNIYVALNNLVKGKIASSTINDLIPTVANELHSENLADISTSLNEIIKGTDFEKLMNGDLSVYKNFIQDFEATTNGFALSINAKAFGLGDYVLKIVLDDTTNDLSNGFLLSIENFQYNNIKLSFSLNVRPQESIHFRYTDEEFASFKDYCGIISIFNTVSKLADERKLNTAYTFNLQDLANKTNYLASGEISADVSNLSLDSGNNYYGDYRLTLATNLNGYDHSLDFAYQNHDLYLQLDSFFKQKISDSEVGAIYDLLNKDKEGTSEAFDGMNTVINSIVNEIKETYSLKILEDYFTLDKENVDKNILRLDINLPLFFEGSTLGENLSALSLYVNTDDDSITSLSCKGLKISNKYQLDFTMNLKDEFNDFRLSEEETKYYTEIDSASKVINGFLSLPTDLKQFSVNLSGDIKYKGEDGQYPDYLGLTGDAQVDLTEKESPDVGGTLHLLQQPDSMYDKVTDHEIIYGYSGTHTDGMTLAKYTSKDVGSNDKTGTTSLIMNNSDIFSIYDRVTALKDNETNLLYRYLKGYFDTTEKVVTGLPLMDAIKNKDYTILLNDYIKEVTIKDKTVTLKLASSILNSEDKSDNIDTIIVSFDDNYKISKAEIDGYYNDYLLHAEINLGDYDVSLKPVIEYNDSNKQDFVDVHGFDTLLNCFITTTDHHFFDLSGSFNLPLKFIGIKLASLKTNFNVCVTIVDSTVTAYLSFNKGENTPNDQNFYGVEFFVENDFVLSERTTTDKKKNKTVELIKLTPKEITDNIAYYLLSYILNIENVFMGKTALNEIYKAMNDTSNDSSVSITHNYSSLIDEAKIKGENKDGSGTFNLTCSLGKLLQLPVISFDDQGTNIGIGFDSNKELTSINASVEFRIASVITGSLTLNATRNNICSGEAEEKIMAEKMARYDTFLAAYHNDSDYVNLAEYHINYNVKDGKFSNNGAKHYPSSQSSNFVFGA